MQENEKMKQENLEINHEISKIKEESEIADIDLILARQAFEQGRVETIKVNFYFRNSQNLIFNIQLNQEIEYTIKEIKILKECDLEIIAAEADNDKKILNDKIADRQKENEFLAEKLEKLIELKIEMEQKKEKDKCYDLNKNSAVNNKKG